MKLLKVLVSKPDAALGGSCANRFRRVSAMDANALVASCVKSHEPRTVGMANEPLAIVEVVSPLRGILNLTDVEHPLRRLEVATFLLLSNVLSASHWKFSQHLAIRREQREHELLLVDIDHPFRHVRMILGHYAVIIDLCRCSQAHSQQKKRK